MTRSATGGLEEVATIIWTFLLDVEVELDRRILTVRQILDLDEGCVIRMNRSALNITSTSASVGALLGFGEIVVNEATTGIRLTDFHQS